MEESSRRRFIGTSTPLLAGVVAMPALIGMPAIITSYGKPNSKIKGVQIGTITYSFRSMSDQSAEATLQYVVDAGISAIELMGDPAENFAGKPDNPVDQRVYSGLMRKKSNGDKLTSNEEKEFAEMKVLSDEYSEKVASWRASVSMDKFSQLRKMYRSAGVTIYGFKPAAFGANNSVQEMDYGFRAAKALGATHVTLEHPSNDDRTQKLGMLAAKHKIYVAYHGHEQQTPTLWDTALQQSKYNALNLDLGHYVAAGNADPLGIVKAKHEYILSMHLKDRQTPEHGKKNLPWGEGDTPIVEVLRLMRDQKYAFPASAEVEYEIPEDSDAVKEVARCLEYSRRALEG